MKILLCKIQNLFVLIVYKFYLCSVQNMRLSELIVECQKLMRKYASEQLRCFGLEDNEAKLYATSCVSQRDIQV